MARYVPPPEPKRKSIGEQAQDTIVYLIAVVAIYSILVFMVKIITAPFRILFMTDKQRFAAQLEKARAKIVARECARKVYELSESNPMAQYLSRFKYFPEQYNGDTENETYRVWFDNLKKGTVLDSGLYWAPDVYEVSEEGTKEYSVDFLDYFSRQVEFIKEAPLGAQLKFVRTLQKYYPEFTPNLSVIPSELKDFYERVHSQNLHKELVNVIVGSGIPWDLAEGLVNENLSPADLKAAIRLLQKCAVKKYCKAMSLFCVRYKFNPDLEKDYFSNSVNNILKHTGNEEMAQALIRGDVKAGELTQMFNKATEGADNKEEILALVSRDFFKLMKTKTLREMARG
jgi:hypothetical protein